MKDYGDCGENITKVCTGIGGKAPAIVMDDADLELAVKAIVDSRVINSGQKCVTVQNVFMYRKAFMISSSIGWVKRCRRFNLGNP